MSVSAPVKSRPAFQPFQCHVCQSRFTRHENLKRHSALHNRSEGGEASLPCEFCDATFSRPDLRHRHMKKKHVRHFETESRHRKRHQSPLQTPAQSSVNSGSPKRIRAADGSNSQGTGGSSSEDDDYRLHGNSLQRHVSVSNSTGVEGHDEALHLEPHMLMDSSFLGFDAQMPPLSMSTAGSPMFGTSLADFSFHHGISNDGLLPVDLSPAPQDEWFPSEAQTSRGCHLFFAHVSHFVPFLHRPTLDTNELPTHLLLGMLSLAYQCGEDPESADQGDGSSGRTLSTRCFHRARILVAKQEDGTEDDPAQNLALVQTYLLLQIHAMMYLCGRKESAFGLKTHSKMVSLARAAGLAQPLDDAAATLTATEDLDGLWRHFAAAESRKRTMFAAHQVDTLWYQFLSVPRSLSHLEIKHELPCPNAFWAAPSAVDWAHRQLVARQTGPSSVLYPDAIRRFLSSSPADLASIPAFDPFGAINVTHFLVSSAREISGWSTMTGMVSTERLEPLRSSLLALGPFVRPSKDNGAGAAAAAAATTTSTTRLCEATWQTAMIELLMWSPSHTGGVVEGSMDAVLQQLTRLPSCCEFLCDTGAAQSIQPHVNWFLLYLEETLVPDAEAPWVIIYAYRAFMIAWQLVQAGVADAMEVVNVGDGDAKGALAWAKKVFRRRERWQLGKIVIACLDTMDEGMGS
jgi:hypothetical protein